MPLHRTLISVASILGLALLGACGGGGSDPAPLPTQTLLSVSPEEGSTHGGTEIILKGSGFASSDNRILGVRIGDVIASNWEILDDSTIRAVTPPGEEGAVTVWLLGEEAERIDGAFLARSFTYVAPVVFVAEGPGASNPQLYRVDLSTGQFRLVGAIGFGVEGMALGPDGLLYAVESIAPHRLIRIDPLSAVGSPVALLRDVSTGQPVEILDVTFDGDRLLGRSAQNEIVEIDRSNGQVSLVSTLPGAMAGGGLAAGSDLVWLAPEDDPSALEIWHPAADTTTRGPLLAPGAVLEALALSEGRLLGIDGDPASETGVDLYSIDPDTGALRSVAILPPQAGAIARTR